jgi:adenosylhomocysteine nucleosidase
MGRTDTDALNTEACSEAYYLPLLAITGLAREARLATGPGIVTISAGADPVRLRGMLDARLQPGCRAAISIGIAGGLAPALVPGDIVIATGIITGSQRHAVPATITDRLAGRLSGFSNRIMLADLAGVDAPALTPVAKSTLRRETGAAAVDMESHIAAAFAAKHDLPFAAVRVVCDPADRTLPSCVVSALRPNGSVNVVAVVGALADRSAKLGDLVQLARDSRRAFKALRYCRRALSQDLGIATIREPMGVVLPTTLTLAP